MPQPLPHNKKLWALTLLSVAILAVVSAGLLGWAEAPGLSLSTPPQALLSQRMVPVLQLLFIAAAALGLPALAYAKLRPNLAILAWYILLAASGLASGLMLLIPFEYARVLESGNLGLSNLYEVSIAILAITGTLALGFDRTTAAARPSAATSGLLPFITPVLAAGALFLGWLASIGAGTPKELIPALQNQILPFHVFANFLGYGCFAIAAAAGAALLVRHRADVQGKTSLLPPVPVLEKLGYRAIVLGFPVFTIAVLLGCVWAYQAWGGYWSWDPKETWALIVWLIYAAYLHVRLAHRPKNTTLAWWLLAGFLATLFCYLGVNMFLSGLHSYGTLQS